MKSNIGLAFDKCKKEKRAALITYTVAGDNTKNNSLKILIGLVPPGTAIEALSYLSMLKERFLIINSITSISYSLGSIHS